MTDFSIPTARVVLRVLAASGITVICFALILGSIPIEVGGVDCPAPFGNGGSSFTDDSVACAVARYPRQAMSWLVIIIGSGLLVAALTIHLHLPLTRPTPRKPSGGPTAQ